jgi:hypothetical protein
MLQSGNLRIFAISRCGSSFWKSFINVGTIKSRTRTFLSCWKAMSLLDMLLTWHRSTGQTLKNFILLKHFEMLRGKNPRYLSRNLDILKSNHCVGDNFIFLGLVGLWTFFQIFFSFYFRFSFGLFFYSTLFRLAKSEQLSGLKEDLSFLFL